MIFARLTARRAGPRGGAEDAGRGPAGPLGRRRRAKAAAGSATNAVAASTPTASRTSSSQRGTPPGCWPLAGWVLSWDGAGWPGLDFRLMPEEAGVSVGAGVVPGLVAAGPGAAGTVAAGGVPLLGAGLAAAGADGVAAARTVPA